MAPPHDPNLTADVAPAEDSLDAGLAAAFGPAEPTGQSVLSSFCHTYGVLRPILLRDADGADSAHVVRPHSPEMPPLHETGDRYQLAGEIARGGMGAVLRGRDVDLGRDLAVKVLLEKHATCPEIARRFIEEAQVGAQLQHPGVVPVYDLGRFGNRPFFTMKLVKGRTLSALLAERAGLAEDRPRFLGMFRQVAHTIAYAHAKGVIHRDLKPANVMVGAFGEVQVMDWGLAKVLAEGGLADEEAASRGRQPPEEATVIRTARSGSDGGVGSDTQAGSLMGTPAYMPPEQANGDVEHLDRRADVFGLGAILCEILTGKPPYVGRSADEVRRKAANGDQAEMLARLDACGADAELLTLAKVCLAPEPIDRPRDAQAVGEGLTAYLDGVQERLRQAELDKAAAEARAAAEGRERRAAEGQAGAERRARRVQLALAGTVLLALALGGGGWLWVKADRDARQARVTRDVNAALHQATALRAQAQAAPGGGALLFAQARAQAQRALALVENGPADDTLKDQVTRLQTELDEEEKDRELVAALDAARLAQAELSDERRGFASERAVPMFRDAFRAYGLPAGEGEPAAAAERIRQRPAAVREAIVAALDEWDALAGNPQLGITKPHREWLRAVLGAAEPAEGWTRQFQAAREEKDEARRRTALEKLAPDDVGGLPVRALTRLAGQLEKVEAHGSAARLLRRAQQQYPADFWANFELGSALEKVTPPERDEAVRFLTAAVALRPENSAAHNNLGLALRRKGQVDEAIACYRKAIELNPKYVYAHNNLGVILGDVKRDYDAAIASFRTALALDPKDAKAHSSMGVALRGKGQVDEAIACYKMAIALDPKYAHAHYNLGVALRAKGQVDEAIACYKMAIALDPKLANAHYSLGLALRGKAQVDEAIACYRTAIALDPKHANAHVGLGVLLGDVKRDYDGAIACFRQAIALNPKYALAHNNLGEVLAHKGQVDEAIACYKMAIALDPKLANAHYSLGLALRGKAQVDEAIACYRTAIALDPKHANAHVGLGVLLGDVKRDYDGAIACFRQAIALNPKYALAHNNLGEALAHKGQVDGAIACYQKAIALDPKRADYRKALARAERLAAARDKLPAFRNGSYTPANNEERLGLAEWCQIQKLYQTATGLYVAAFAADPKLADDLDAGHRRDAARSATLAAAGQGEDAGKLDDQERAGRRQQALDWLRADLALRTKQLETGKPADRATVQRALGYWQQDSDFASVRGEEALAKMPEAERAAWRQLWADVAALLK